MKNSSISIDLSFGDKNFGELSTSDYGTILGVEQVMDVSIHQLWTNMQRISGPAFTVQLSPSDNLMLHKAIYEAPRGSIVVVDGVDTRTAVAGGNVCAVAQKNGIIGFVIDGMIRDIEEIKSLKFPVLAKGTTPVPGKKNVYSELEKSIRCGGVVVNSKDIIVADSDGVVVIPRQKALEIYEQAKKKAAEDRAMTLEEWEKKHKQNIERAIEKARNPKKA